MNKLDIGGFYRELDAVLRRKDAGESEAFLLGALQEAEGYGDLAGITAVCNELGGFYRAAGRLAETKPIYQRVLTNLKEMGMERTGNYAAALINWGNVFVAEKDYEKGLEIYKEAMDILEGSGPGGDYPMAALCNSMSAIYRETGRLDDSEYAAKKSLEIIKQFPGSRMEMATTYVSLGEVQMKKGDLVHARESLLTAMGIFEADSQGKDPHYAAARAAMGELEYRAGNYGEAARQYEKTLELMERDFGKTPYYDIIKRNLEMVKERL